MYVLNKIYRKKNNKKKKNTGHPAVPVADTEVVKDLSDS